MKKLYIGLDPSFTGTGLVVLNKDADIVDKQLIKTSSNQCMEERLINIVKDLDKFIDSDNNSNLIYIEGPSYSSNGAFTLQMGALHYYIRIFLYKNSLEYVIIPPTKLKKFVTGKGNCKKELILLKIYKKWGVEFDDNNIADAYGLARMALEGYTM